jgi:phosphoribosylglycinamide formyltransferase-1
MSTGAAAPARLAVLISGHGSNLQAILDACAGGDVRGQVVVVVSNREEAFGLERARRAGVPAIPLPKMVGQTRRGYDAGLADLVAGYSPDWVVLAGWMRLLTSAFLDRFPGRVVNLHPALPGAFAGAHAVERAFDAFHRGQIENTGVMVHLVPDEGVDSGPVLAQALVEIHPDDDLAALETRVHTIEHELLIATLSGLCKSGQNGFSQEE